MAFTVSTVLLLHWQPLMFFNYLSCSMLYQIKLLCGFQGQLSIEHVPIILVMKSPGHERLQVKTPDPGKVTMKRQDEIVQWPSWLWPALQRSKRSYKLQASSLWWITTQSRVKTDCCWTQFQNSQPLCLGRIKFKPFIYRFGGLRRMNM